DADLLAALPTADVAHGEEE
ncbi:hypothetical protein, partial, partial [Absidia glauca]